MEVEAQEAAATAAVALAEAAKVAARMALALVVVETRCNLLKLLRKTLRCSVLRRGAVSCAEASRVVILCRPPQPSAAPTGSL